MLRSVADRDSVEQIPPSYFETANERTVRAILLTSSSDHSSMLPDPVGPGLWIVRGVKGSKIANLISVILPLAIGIS